MSLACEWDEGNFSGKRLGKQSLARPRGRREDNIKMDVRKTGYEDGMQMELAQDLVQWRGLAPWNPKFPLPQGKQEQMSVK
jgi:hypothetical protein